MKYLKIYFICRELRFFVSKWSRNIKEIYNLLVNADKTEQATLSRSGKEYKNAKKVGTLICDEEDIKRRKSLSPQH